MKIIIPMAGRGTRLRPHTLTTPKPLIEILGKPIVVHLIEEIKTMLKTEIEEIAFIIGRFGKDVEKKLMNLAKDINAKGKILYQDDPLGTAHAVNCAKEYLEGEIIIAFADTIFKSGNILLGNEEAVIWVKEVEDPSEFGVVTTNGKYITGFVEKPKDFISNEAIIGLYYFKEGERLRKEIIKTIDNNIVKGGEYQLTDALENLRTDGMRIETCIVEKWLDCGNKDSILNTQKELLNLSKSEYTILSKGSNTIVIEPSYVERDVVLENCIIGPYAAINKGCIIQDAIIKNSIVQDNSKIRNAVIENTIIGKSAIYEGKTKMISISDYSSIEE